MKSLLLLGGGLGLGVGMGFSYLQGDSWPACLWHGCLAAYLTALLVRWWGRSWRKNREQSLEAREAAGLPILPTANTPKVSRT
jgi:hypothetical protein